MHLQSWNPPSHAVAGGAQILPRAKSSTICLPSTLLNTVPTCALNCVLNFAVTNYESNSCSHTSSLNFLCTQNTVSGLSIGEASVQCIASFCVGFANTEANASNICNSVVKSTSSKAANTVTATVLPPSSSTVQRTSVQTTAVVSTPPAPVATQPPSTSNVIATTPTPPAPVVAPSPVAASPSVTESSIESQTSSPLSFLSTMASTPINSPVYTSAVAVPDQDTPQNALNTAQIVGIAVASAATAILVLVGFIMMYLLRKQRQNNRRSKRWSGTIHPTPPPTYDGLGSVIAKRPASGYPALTSHDPNQRFYAPPQPEEKRRSFWRKSIKPEDIGVAVSPRAFQLGSPMSIYSSRNEEKLLPKLPAEALWPAPLDLDTTRQRQLSNERPQSEVTEFDEEIELKVAEASAASMAPQTFTLAMPPAVRRKQPKPAPLRIPSFPRNPFQPYSKRNKDSGSTRIPMTPTYDNGTFDSDISPPRRTPQSPQDIWEEITYPESPKVTSPEHRLRASSTYANRNVLRKKSVGNVPSSGFRIPSSSYQGIPEKKPVSPRNSVWSGPTNIEEDSTPEHESDKQLSQTPRTLKSLMIGGHLPTRDDSLTSPIKDLKYPTIPRSAALSRQAENIPLPRAALGLQPPPKLLSPFRSTRDQLVRAEASFVQTETTSSDGYMSDQSIEWPVPPAVCKWTGKPLKNQRAFKSQVARLSENPTSMNRGTGKVLFTPPKQVIGAENTIDQVLTMQKPASKARIVPSKSRTGDLYLTVEL